MDTQSVVLMVKVVFSLAVVLGLLWFIGRRLKGAGLGPRAHTPLTVVSKQSLGGRSAVAIVAVGERRLLLGVGEHGVSMLTELDPEPVAAPAADRVPITVAELEELVGPFAGPEADPSDLSPATGTTPAVPTPALDALVTVPARGVTAAAEALPLSIPAARMPAVPMSRSPLEGSILAPSTWRRAVAAVQERTIRH